MQIREISVTIHEKRNHPYAYGNYDCEVRLTAALGEEDDGREDDCIDELADTARANVLAELDAWEDGVIQEHELQERINRIGNRISDLGWRYGNEDFEDRVLAILDEIELLPEEMRDKFIKELDLGVKESKSKEKDIPF